MGVRATEPLPLLDVLEHSFNPLRALSPHDEIVECEEIFADVILEELVHVGVGHGEGVAGGVDQRLAGLLDLYNCTIN